VLSNSRVPLQECRERPRRRFPTFLERRRPILLFGHNPVNGKALLALVKRTSSKSPPAAPLQISREALQTIQKGSSKEEEQFILRPGLGLYVSRPGPFSYPRVLLSLRAPIRGDVSPTLASYS
jgi:hypothetical protein